MQVKYQVAVCAKNLNAMKRRFLLIITLLVLVVGGVNAQKQRVKNLPTYDFKPVHFGFTVGLNTMDFVITPSQQFINSNRVFSVENQKMPGFNLGPIVNFRLGRYFDLRTLVVLSFGQRNLSYRVSGDTAGAGTRYTMQQMELESTFLEFPLLIKYKAQRLNNFRPYMVAGINPKIDLASRKEIKEEEQPEIRLKNYDLYYEFGLGIDFYLTYFKLSTELKYSQGIINVMEPDATAYTNVIDQINSRMFMLSFHFE